MICALMHVLPPDRVKFAEKVFYEFWSSPENKATLLPLMKDFFPPILGYRETRQEDGAAYNALDSKEGQAIAKLAEHPDELAVVDRLDRLDLASPVLKEGAIRKLFHLKGITHSAKIVLSANPNCPTSLAIPPTDADMPFLARVAARYGA